MAKLMDVGEVAKALHVSRSRVYRELRHALPWVVVGKSLRLRRADLDEFISKHQVPVAKAA